MFSIYVEPFAPPHLVDYEQDLPSELKPRKELPFHLYFEARIGMASFSLYNKF